MKFYIGRMYLHHNTQNYLLKSTLFDKKLTIFQFIHWKKFKSLEIIEKKTKIDFKSI